MYGGELSGETYSDEDAGSATSSAAGSYRGRRSRRDGGVGAGAGSVSGSVRSDGDVSLLGTLNGLFGYAEEALNELSDNYTFEVRPEIRLKLRKRCVRFARREGPRARPGRLRAMQLRSRGAARALRLRAARPMQHTVGHARRQLRGPNRAHRGGGQARLSRPAVVEGAHRRGAAARGAPAAGVRRTARLCAQGTCSRLRRCD